MGEIGGIGLLPMTDDVGRGLLSKSISFGKRDRIGFVALKSPPSLELSGS